MVKISAFAILISILFSTPANYNSLIKDYDKKEKQIIETQTQKVDIISEKIFTIRYKILSKDQVPYGDKYQISVPLDSSNLNINSKIIRTCDISIKNTDFYISTKSNYTQREINSSINKQLIKILYNLLNEYRDGVIECMILSNAFLVDETITNNLVAKQHTFLNTNFLQVLASLDGNILTIKILKKD